MSNEPLFDSPRRPCREHESCEIVDRHGQRLHIHVRRPDPAIEPLSDSTRYAYWWLRWGVLLAGLVNIAVVVAMIWQGNAAMIVGNIAAAGVCIGVFVWARWYRRMADD